MSLYEILSLTCSGAGVFISILTLKKVSNINVNIGNITNSNNHNTNNSNNNNGNINSYNSGGINNNITNHSLLSSIKNNAR